jgi:hypothetical protein
LNGIYNKSNKIIDRLPQRVNGINQRLAQAGVGNSAVNYEPSEKKPGAPVNITPVDRNAAANKNQDDIAKDFYGMAYNDGSGLKDFQLPAGSDAAQMGMMSQFGKLFNGV